MFVLFTTHHTSSCFAQKHAVGASGPFVSWYLHHASEINEATTLILLTLKATSKHKNNPTKQVAGGDGFTLRVAKLVSTPISLGCIVDISILNVC